MYEILLFNVIKYLILSKILLQDPALSKVERKDFEPDVLLYATS